MKVTKSDFFFYAEQFASATRLNGDLDTLRLAIGNVANGSLLESDDPVQVVGSLLAITSLCAQVADCFEEKEVLK